MERGSSGIARRERGQITLQRSGSQAYHEGSPVWVPERSEGGLVKQKVGRWVKGVVLRTGTAPDGSFKVLVQTEEGHQREFSPNELPLQNERDDTVDDLVKSDFLHEPGRALRNPYLESLFYPNSTARLSTSNAGCFIDRHFCLLRSFTLYKVVNCRYLAGSCKP